MKSQKFLYQDSVVVTDSTRKGVVGVGTQVTVEVNGSSHIFKIVGEWEADPAEKKISHESPLGQALMDRKVGEVVEVEAPAGKITYKIVEVK
jgi:transcription elongation factor GreA